VPATKYPHVRDLEFQELYKHNVKFIFPTHFLQKCHLTL
jgi:hypothetical protein